MKLNKKDNKKVKKYNKSDSLNNSSITGKKIKESGKLGSSQKKKLIKRVKQKCSKITKEKNVKETDGMESDNSDLFIAKDDDKAFEKADANLEGFDEMMYDSVDEDLNEDIYEDDGEEEEEELEENDEDSAEDDEEEKDHENSEDSEENDVVTNVINGDNAVPNDLAAINNRIEANFKILQFYSDFKAKHPNAEKRSFYVNQWLQDLSWKFSYNKFLINKLYYIFNLDLIRFLEQSEEDRPITIRCNTLKTTRQKLSTRLTNMEFMVENIEFTKVGLVIYSSKCSIGSTKEYMDGQYMLQGSSSMTPVLALAPKPGDRILDMCAAPGGKTTHIAQIMKGQGQLIANDINKDRMKSIQSNILRMGITNVVLCNYDSRKIHHKVNNFDRILCDAPCTGTGVISKDKSIKASKDEQQLRRVTLDQKKLVLAAAECLKVNGFLVYSTCSVLTEENEEVIDYLCRKKHMKIVETGLFGTKGFVNFRSRHFNKDMEKTRRYYPHENNMDGFFIAKLQKIANGTKS